MKERGINLVSSLAVFVSLVCPSPLVSLFLQACQFVGSQTVLSPSTATSRPNILIILSDDQRYDTIPYGKNSVYEESSRVPFAVRYPRLVVKPRVETRLVANIDIAPTSYELAKVAIPIEVDGRSLVPLLGGNSKTSPYGQWREELLLEGWAGPALIKEGRAPYAAIHTGHFVYVETEGDRSELYDLTTDPYQLQNQIDNPAYLPVVTDLKARLKRRGKK
jgi:arylsulfatase A-like enzyme